MSKAAGFTRAQLLTALRRLTEPYTAPYDEAETRAVVHALLTEHGIGFSTDAFGNTVARVRRGMPRSKVAFVAHLDHPALRVESVRGNQVTCKAEGGLPTVGIKNSKVRFPNADGGAATGKVLTAKVARVKGRDRIESAVVQLAAKSHPPAEGDFGIFDLPSLAARGQRLKLRVADDLVGALSIIAGLSQLAKAEVTCEAWGVFTRAEEVGLQGAVALAVEGGLPRDLNVVSIECSKAYDDIKLGGGPVVRLGDRSGPFDPRAVALVKGAAKHLAEQDKKFAYQSALMAGGTCEATAFCAFGYRAAGIAIPLAAYHNQGAKGVVPEEVDIRDVEGVVRLVCATAERAGAGIDDLDLLRNELVRSSEEGRQRLRGGGPSISPFAAD